jgi:hypothetical protein
MTISDLWVLRGVPVLFARAGMMLSKYWDSERVVDRLYFCLRSARGGTC